MSNSEHTAFRKIEKHFKNRAVLGKRGKAQLPSLRQHGVVDLSRPTPDEVSAAGWWGDQPAAEQNGGRNLKSVVLSDGRMGWQLGEGCVLIPGYLSEEEQLQELQASLAAYTLPPNPLSLSTHYDLPPDLFDLYAADSDTLVQPLHASTSALPTPPQTPSPTTSANRVTIDTAPASKLGYEQILAANKNWVGDRPSDRLKPATAHRLMKDLRWANLGWVYKWTTKAYDFTCDEPIPFPAPLRQKCSAIVSSIPWSNIFSSHEPDSDDWKRWHRDYEPDTGIVNFYQLKDTLMGHVDRAELDPSRPLVSISLGHACIFLLGSSVRDLAPIPVILRSGDVLVMSGKSRTFYHGVPRIMEGSLPKHFLPSEDDSRIRAACKRWISKGRVNINARQVFPPGFQRPPLNA